jgi:DNA replication protein DnaC
MEPTELTKAIDIKLLQLRYATPDLLVIDEVGQLPYSSRFADFLFEVISRRYQAKSTITTTSRAFKEWHEVFPDQALVVYETLNDLIDLIWRHYGLDIQHAFKNQRADY